MPFPPPLRDAEAAICVVLDGVSAWGAWAATCRPSSQACPATSAPPSSRACAATATPSAASPARASGWRRAGVELDDLVLGDATTGAGLDEALDGVDVAYYLIHSMEGVGGALRGRRAPPGRGLRRRGGRRGRAPDRLSRRPAARPTPRRRAILPRGWRSRRRCWPPRRKSVALRASIVVAARSRSFRFLVRLIERLPVLALPAWRVNRTRPVDGRDVLEFLAAAATLAARAHRPRVGHRRAGRHELPADARADRAP